MNFLAAKVKDALFKAAEDKIEAEILKSMGEVKVTIGDINKKVDKLEGGQAQIAAQITALTNEVGLVSTESPAAQAAGRLQTFFDDYTMELAICKDHGNTTSAALENVKADLLVVGTGVTGQLDQFHNAIVGANSTLSLTQTFIDYHWGRHENNNYWTRDLEFGIVALCNKIRDFVNHTADIQTIGLYLLSAIYDKDHLQKLAHRYSAQIIAQAKLLCSILPPCIDLSKEHVDDFLVGPEFWLELQNVSNGREWLSSALVKEYGSGFGRDQPRTYVIPYVWNQSNKGEINNRKGYNWTLERAGDTGYYHLTGYNIHPGYNPTGRPEKVNIRWEPQGMVEKDYDYREGKKPRYVTRWWCENVVVSFKAILMKSRMQNDPKKIMLRFVDKDFDARRKDDPREWFSDEAFSTSTTFYYEVTL